ncbi:hypothetical protein BK816_01550 [Boudabousia tangfeifanii]|uniref:beta-N-acetylhexosaminidase n=1 Tax=Boudabousia tangfeifanii TaxID=1912795 RepID=A0A1D9MIH8_9ACTO|nr:family 20 glycosylhydrolase [Boudabousia tangfeifanii]AOZ72141.1 hypothetical protein BK816_01550 [Boudabousia tangfeifanii]
MSLKRFGVVTATAALVASGLGGVSLSPSAQADPGDLSASGSNGVNEAVPAASSDADDEELDVPEDNGEGLNAVIPTPQSMNLDGGTACVTRPDGKLILRGGDERRTADAKTLAAQLKAATGHEYQVAAEGSPRKGDIVLETGQVSSAPEGKQADAYQLNCAKGVITLKAPEARGLYYAGQTMLQALRSGHLVQSGEVADWSDYPVRSLHVDAARKYFPKDWFLKEIDRMSSLKINQLQWHFSENEGFRLESKKHPNLMSPEFITQDEAKEIVAYAKSRHVEVVPAFDMPGHLQWILKSKPEFRASEDEYAQKMIDYSNPEAVNFLKGLVDEFAPIFAGQTTTWMIGGDEVFPMDWIPNRLASKLPKLKKYAEDQVGAGAQVMDGYMHFLKEMDKYVKAKGYTTSRVWSDLLYTSEMESIPGDVQVGYWTQWSWKMPSTEKLVQHGHKLLNVSDKYFYYVLPACPTCAYHDHADAPKILSEYNPRIFPEKRTREVEPDHVLGSSYAIWCDKPDLKTADFIGDDSLPMLAAMSQKTWKPSQKVSAADFVRRVKANDKAMFSPVPVVPPAFRWNNQVNTTPEPGEVGAKDSLSYRYVLENTGRKQLNPTAKVVAEGLPMSWADAKAELTMPEPPQPPNLALERPVTVSGHEVRNRFPKEKATDGITEPADLREDRWSSNESDNAWIYVDLGEDKTLDKVKIYWENACAARYKIQVSRDAEHWTDATEELTATNCPKVDTVKLNAEGKWRYVKMQGLKRTAAANGNFYGMSLYEFEVYPPAKVVPTPEVPAVKVEGNALTWTGVVPAGATLTLSGKAKLNASPAGGELAIKTVSSSAKLENFTDAKTFTVAEQPFDDTELAKELEAAKAAKAKAEDAKQAAEKAAEDAKAGKAPADEADGAADQDLQASKDELMTAGEKAAAEAKAVTNAKESAQKVKELAQAAKAALNEVEKQAEAAKQAGAEAEKAAGVAREAEKAIAPAEQALADAKQALTDAKALTDVHPREKALKVQIATEKVAETEAKLAEAKAKSAEADTKLAIAQTKANAAAKQTEAAQTRAKVANTRLEMMALRNSALQAEEKAVKGEKDLADAKEKNQELASQLEKAQQGQQVAEDEATKAKADAAKKTEELASAKADLVKAKEQVTDANRKAAEAKNQADAAEAKAEAAKAEAQAANGKLQEATARAEAAEKKAAEAYEQAKAAGKSEAEARAAEKAAKAEAEQARQAEQAAKADAQKAREAEQAARDEATQARSAEQAAKADANKARAQAQQAQAKASSAEARANLAEKKLTKANADLRASQKEVKELKEKLGQKPPVATPEPPSTGTPEEPSPATPEVPSPATPEAPVVDYQVTLKTLSDQVNTEFKDMPHGTQFAGEVKWLRHKGITTGWPDGTFRPLAPMTRAAMITFIYRLEGQPEVKVPKSNVFKDVPASYYFSKEIAWAKAKGITTGWADGTFHPEESVSREAIAAFLHRYCENGGKCHPDLRAASLDRVKAQPRFKDVPAKSLFAKDINWLAKARVTTGWPDGTFRPHQPVQRDAMAAFFYRLTHNTVDPIKK